MARKAKNTITFTYVGEDNDNHACGIKLNGTYWQKLRKPITDKNGVTRRTWVNVGLDDGTIDLLGKVSYDVSYKPSNTKTLVTQQDTGFRTIEVKYYLITKPAYTIIVEERYIDIHKQTSVFFANCLETLIRNTRKPISEAIVKLVRMKA